MLQTSTGIDKQLSTSCAFYTYAHINLSTNKIFYIGKGKKSRYLATAKRNPHWQNIVKKHGFKAEILAYWKTSEEALSHEMLLIASFKDMGYVLANKTTGGEDCQMSEETKTKIGLSLIGKKRSLESRKKMSIAAKNRAKQNRPPCKASTKQLLSDKLKGRVITDEWRNKISVAKKLASKENL